MKKYVLFIMLFLIGCGPCSGKPEDEYNREIKKSAIEQCIKLNGIPIIDGWNKLEDCKFPPIAPQTK